VTTATGGL